MVVSRDEFGAHPVHVSLKELEQSLNSEDIKLADSAEHDRLDSLKTAANYVSCRLNCASPLLINVNVLDNLNKHVVKMKDEFSVFLSRGDRAHFDNAVATVDNVIGQARNLVVLGRGKDGDLSLTNEVADFRESAKLVLGELKDKQDAFASQIANLGQKTRELEQDIEKFKELSASTLNSLRRR